MRSPHAVVLASVLVTSAACGSADPPARVHAPPRAVTAASPSSPLSSASAPPASASGAAAAPPEPAPVEAPEPERPLPAGFVAIAPPMDDGGGRSRAARCGALQVENVRGDPRVYEPYVVVTDAATGKKVYEAHGRRMDMDGTTVHMELTATVCGDLTGDGVAELLLTERTMGAHCCYTHYVTSLTSPSKLILTWDKGDSGNPVLPVKLSPGKAWQLQSVDIVWPPFDAEKGDPSVAYAGAPGFPIVFDLVGDHYEKRTFRFLDALRREHDEELAACAARKDCEPYVLYEWGMALMLGRWDADKERIVPEADLREQLDRRAKAMKDKLRKQLGG